MTPPPPDARKLLSSTGRTWLFLDYDGTLADFAPTPAVVEPDPEVVQLLSGLAGCPGLRVVVLSGRRLDQVAALVPVPGVTLAGTYGLELLVPPGERLERLDYARIRPEIEAIKADWTALAEGKEGFFLEDKGWSLAMHARFTPEPLASQTIEKARAVAGRLGPGFCLLGGERFLEAAPCQADKRLGVEYILERFPWPGAGLIYCGDDDKDEAAFEEIHSRGGVCLVVGPKQRPSQADYRLPGPTALRTWLAGLNYR